MRRADALLNLFPEQEAVEIHGQLAPPTRSGTGPHLATSLSNLGALFAALGRPLEALPPPQEAVEIHRQQAAADPRTGTASTWPTRFGFSRLP